MLFFAMNIKQFSGGVKKKILIVQIKSQHVIHELRICYFSNIFQLMNAVHN